MSAVLWMTLAFVSVMFINQLRTLVRLGGIEQQLELLTKKVDELQQTMMQDHEKSSKTMWDA
jgi:hypothetical protein